MKKIALFTLALSLALSITASVHAQNTNSTLRRDAAETRKELRQDLKDQMKEAQASDSASKNNRARLKNADLTAISGTTLTVTKDGKTYTVTTDAGTKLRRHYAGISTLAEFSVGNKLDVRGTYTDAAKTTIAARSIRNNSIMVRRGTFIGEVASKSGNTFVLKSKNRGDQTITVTPTTKYVNRRQTPITINDIIVGHRVRVKGMWDKSNNSVTLVTQVKDFSLPPKATGSASPTNAVSQ